MQASELEAETGVKKTPEKLSPTKEDKTDFKMQTTSSELETKTGVEKTPEKFSPIKEDKDNSQDNTTSSKEEIIKNEIKTPEKTEHNNSVTHSVENTKIVDKTPDKNVVSLKSEQISCDGEDGMISTAEQARLLIAANKTPSKYVHKTPVKQHTPSGKRSAENSPGTPGKYKRVELITLASPKAKRIKQI